MDGGGAADGAYGVGWLNFYPVCPSAILTSVVRRIRAKAIRSWWYSVHNLLMWGSPSAGVYAKHAPSSGGWYDVMGVARRIAANL